MALLSALKLECMGMKRSRPPSAYAIVREEYGLSGTKQEVFNRFEAMIKVANRKRRLRVGKGD